MKAKNLLLNFNKLKGNKKFKTLFLAGLIGLLPSCRDDFNEPDSTKTQTNTQQTFNGGPNNVDSYPVDSFMKHVPNVDGALFYQPREDNHLFYFETNGIDVTGMTEICDYADSEDNILYPNVFTRADNTCVNGVAHFTGMPSWNYSVNYTKPNGEKAEWSIENVSQEEYEDIFVYEPNQNIANTAKYRIRGKSGDYAHADSIYNNILRGNGVWTYGATFPLTVNSKGAQQKLQYSDFGTFEYSDSENNHFTKMYSGGAQESGIDKAYMPATTFVATAFGNVQRNGQNSPETQLVLTTGKDSATYTIADDKTETIVMPFKNWYKVTIVRGQNSVVTYLEDVNNNVPQEWKMINTSIHENQYYANNQPNDLFATDGWRVENYQEVIRTSISSHYYMDQSGYVETVFQGYRQDASNTDRVVFTFCLGGTNRPDQGTATGLELIYCAPARRGNSHGSSKGAALYNKSVNAARAGIQRGVSNTKEVQR